MIDIIIDFGRINNMAIDLINAITEDIKKATLKVQVKSIIILASAFPEGISIKSDTIGEIPRYDWILFSGIHKLLPNIIFGDYGSDDPFDPHIDSRMNIVPTIRYTSNDCWKIIRGHYDPTMPFDFSQFHDLSKALIKSSFYSGKEFSWGDNTIFQCANKECGNGNLETWVRVAMNHHITFVSNECAHLL